MARKEINVTLGQRTKERRKQLKLTQEQLAEKINISVRFMADVEGGQVGVSLSTLKELCMALGCSADYLLGLDSASSADDYAFAIRKIQQIPLDKIKSVEKILNELQDIIKKS